MPDTVSWVRSLKDWLFEIVVSPAPLFAHSWFAAPVQVCSVATGTLMPATELWVRHLVEGGEETGRVA